MDRDELSAAAPTRKAVEALFARRHAAYLRLDPVALAADYATDAIVESPFGGVQHGPAGAEQSLRKFFDVFKGLRIETQAPIIDGLHVAQEAIVSATGVQEFQGRPASDRDLRFVAALIYELRGVAILRERRVYDSTGMWVQVGVLKVKPA